LLILRLIQGIGAAPLGALTVTIIGDLYSRKELIVAMGYNSSIRSIGSAIYPAIGGALAMIGWHYPFILPVIAVPIGFLVLFALKVREPENELHIREHLNIVWKKLRNRQVARLLVIGIIIFIMFFGSYMTCFPLLLGNSFAASPLIIGLIMASISLIDAFTSSQLGKITRFFSERTILKISFILYALALLIISLISQLWLFFIPVIIFGIAHGMSIPVIQAFFAEEAPLKYRATFMSVSGMTFRMGQTLGPFLMGLVIGVWGISGAFYAGVILSITMFIIVFGL
jgi:MFS family permease